MPRQQRDHRGESFEIRNTTRATTDHDEIRRWAEQWNARPARVRGTGGRNLAFLYEERSDGGSSNFSRLVSRATVEDLVRADADRLAYRVDSHDVR